MIKFENLGTDETVTTWGITVNGASIGEVSRERPTRWHANGVSGLVRDRQAPWLWVAVMEDGSDIIIPDGSSAAAAKKLIKAAVSTVHITGAS